MDKQMETEMGTGTLEGCIRIQMAQCRQDLRTSGPNQGIICILGSLGYVLAPLEAAFPPPPPTRDYAILIVGQGCPLWWFISARRSGV